MPKEAETSVLSALADGYRLIDTANAYMNEKAYKEGKVKAIGLSNFNQEQIEEILASCEVKPTVLQTEVHPYFQEKELKKFLAQNEIMIQSWYPLGHGDAALLNEPVFVKLGEKYHKSAALDNGKRYYTSTPEMLKKYVEMVPPVDTQE